MVQYRGDYFATKVRANPNVTLRQIEVLRKESQARPSLTALQLSTHPHGPLTRL